MDHVPSRAMFWGRRWPEDYVFPACSNCNSATRNAEQIVALISRLYPDPPDEQTSDESRRIWLGIRNNFPALLFELLPSRDDQEHFLRKYGSSPAVMAASRHVLRLDGPIVVSSIKAFARKLMCALHYKITHGQIIPPSGGITYHWYSNVQALDGRIPSEFIAALDNKPELKRGKVLLGDQFQYAYSVSDSGDIGMYFASFRFSFAIAGFVAFDPAVLSETDRDGLEILKPIRWP